MPVGWTVGIAAFLLLCVGLIYVFYLRILIVASAAVSVLFGGAWIVALGTLFFAAPFEHASAVLVERTGLPAFLRELDTRIEAIEELPQIVWDRLKSPFGPAPQEMAGPDPAPTAGALEAALVPAFVASVSTLLRGVAFALSALSMVAALSLRSATAAASELQALRHRLSNLESALETKDEPQA